MKGNHLALSEYGDDIRASLDHFGIPGAAVGVSRQGKIATDGFGLASMVSGLPVTADTVFRVASITKPMTATLIMTLVEDGSLDLDRPVFDLLPNLQVSDGARAWQKSITLRHLLRHTAGIDCELEIDLRTLGNGSNALGRAIDLYAGLHQWAAPGQVMSYANTGYWLAGHLAAHVTGLSFEHAMRSRVLRPLGLEHTVFSADGAIVFPVALGHKTVHGEGNDHQPIRSFAYARARRASGGVISSVSDLLGFANWHLGIAEHGPNVSPTMRESMQHPEVRLRSADDESWGLGWNVRFTDGGVKVIGHGGSYGGYQTQLTLVPEKNFAFAMLTNSSQGSKAIRRIERTVLTSELGLALPQPKPMVVPRAALRDLEGTWAQPLGRYQVSATSDGLDIVIETLDRHGKATEVTSPVHFEPIADTDFIVRHGEHKGMRADFIRQPETGAIDFLRVGLRVARRQ